MEWFKVEMSISTQKQNIIISWSQTVNMSTCRFKTAIDSASLSTKMSIFSCWKKRVLQDAFKLFSWNMTNIEANRPLVLRRFAFHFFLFYYDLSWQFAFVNSSISHLRQLALLKWRFISEGFVCTHLNINLMGHKLCLRAGTLWDEAWTVVWGQELTLLIFSLASTHFDTYN